MGTSTVESASTPVNTITKGDCLPNFLTILSKAYIPATEAKQHQPPIHNPKRMFRFPWIENTIVVPIVENKIMYIPVAEATEGGTPWLSKSGLNMAPPLRPKHPEAHPPINAVITTDLTVFLLNLISLGIKPLPTLVLRAYSAIILLMAITETVKQIAAYKATRIQSATPQCSTSPLVDLLPLIALMIIWEIKTIRQVICLSHYQCVFSLLSIAST